MIVFVGVLPPPASGAPAVTCAMLSRLRAHGHAVKTINLSPWGRLEQTLVTRSLRVFKVLAGLVGMLWAAIRCRVTVAYIALSSGYGRIYDILFAAIARCLGLRLILHHHSTACLVQRSLVTALLCRAAGPDAVHVVQCQNMGERMKSIYDVKAVHVLSNAFAVRAPPEVVPTAHKSKLRIGFLSNIVAKKGVFEFIAAVRQAGLSVTGLEGTIAGPLQDDAIRERLEANLRGGANIRWIGPLAAREREVFFGALDVLLFPSVLFEAEPMVVLEALAHGVPVIATDRGCMSTLLTPGAGTVVTDDASYVPEAARLIRESHGRIGESVLDAASARARFEELLGESDRQLDLLLSRFGESGGR